MLIIASKLQFSFENVTGCVYKKRLSVLFCVLFSGQRYSHCAVFNRKTLSVSYKNNR